MTVYPSSVLSQKGPKVKVEKRVAKKTKPVLEPIAEAIEEALQTPVVKVKKPRSEKQLAADARRKELMTAKAAALHTEKLKALYHEPKTAPKVIKPKIRPAAQVLPNDENVAPKWFHSSMANFMVGENKKQEERKPSSEVKAEAAVMATEKWQDSGIRACVEKEVKTHQQKMYNMMFRR